VIRSYFQGEIPTFVQWDGHHAFGKAEPGEYDVTVIVCDIHNVCADDTGVITIFAPVVAPLQIFVSPLSPVVAAPPVVEALVPVPPVETRAVFARVGKTRPSSGPLAATVATVMLGCVFASTSLADPRPKAVHRLTAILRSGD
jgi:hypothetical protein